MVYARHTPPLLDSGPVIGVRGRFFAGMDELAGEIY